MAVTLRRKVDHDYFADIKTKALASSPDDIVFRKPNAMDTNLENLVRIRNAQPSDLGFVYSTWLKGLYHGCKLYKDILKLNEQHFTDRYHEMLKKVIFGKEAVVRIAALREDDDTIIGYAVYNKHPAHLHWVFVKPAFRRLGLAKKLVPDSIVACTQLTTIGEAIKPDEWIYRPLVI